VTIEIEGIRSSAEIRAELAAAGRPVMLAFSCGKDSIAAWLALRDSGVEDIRPYCMEYVPGLQFVQDSLEYFEDYFGTRIARYPHPSIYRWLNNFVFQAPERCAIIEAADLPTPTYEQIVELIRGDFNVPADTWVCDGVRAADSIVRRVSIKRHGPMKPKSGKVSPVWDWRKHEVYDRIEAANITLPPDYEWFGRSFDGLDYRFLEPLSRNAPEDYQRILEWFPLADLELIRRDI
jgi:hypothetical protein